jgi:hypothetical protein
MWQEDEEGYVMRSLITCAFYQRGMDGQGKQHVWER